MPLPSRPSRQTQSCACSSFSLPRDRQKPRVLPRKAQADRSTAAVDVFGRDQVERARRYWRPRYAAALANAALGLALLAVLAVAGFGRIDGWPWWAAAPAIAAITIALGTLIRLPV